MFVVVVEWLEVVVILLLYLQTEDFVYMTMALSQCGSNLGW